jgi:uncharacterized membrane protein YjfL (UPF0719 family)
MEISTSFELLTQLGINFTYAICGLLVALSALYLIDHFIYRRIDFIDEIKRGNIAASIFYSVVLIFVAIVVSQTFG